MSTISLFALEPILALSLPLLGPLLMSARREREIGTQQLQQEIRALQLQAQGNREAAAEAERMAHQLAEALEQERQALAQTASEIISQLGEVRTEIAHLSDSIIEAVRVRDLAEIAGEIARVSVATMGEDARAVADLQRQVEEKAQRLQQQMESELSFLTTQPEVGFAALLTLQAMWENGYRLRQTLSKEGLIAYFDSEDAAHQIAVRCRAPQRLDPQSPRWEMEAETFGIQDESCCGVMTNFFEGLEETNLCEITVKERRYPKRGKGIPPLRQERRSKTPTPARLRE